MENVKYLLETTMQADPNIRAQSEKTLKTFDTQAGFLPALLEISAIDSGATSKAASIYFKNCVTNWEKIPKSDKQLVKRHLLDAITKSNSKKILVAACGVIVRFETHSNSWPTLLKEISVCLSSHHVSVIHTGLTVFLEAVKSWQWSQNEQRDTMNLAIHQMFPSLLQLGQRISTLRDPESYFLLKTIIKTYFCATRMDLNQELQDSANLILWVTLFISVIEWKEGQDGHASFLEIENPEREALIFWKCKKWAYSCVNSLMGRYARARKKDKKYGAFSKFFLDNLSPQILNVYLTQIDWHMNNNWCSSRAHLNAIVMRFIFPQLCFSNADAEIWEEDPVEYVHKKIDPPLDDFKNPSNACENLLSVLVANKTKQTFVPIVTMINDALNTPGLSSASKYGLFSMMIVISEIVLGEESPIKNQIENFLVTRVLFELESNQEHKFLQSKACDVLAKYASAIEHKDNSQCAILCFQGIMNMLKDKDLPVRVSASLALTPLLKYSSVREAIKPHVVAVMHEITALIDLDTLSECMETLVFDFSEELKPFATQFASQLCTSLMRLLGECNFNDDADFEKTEEKTMAAMGIMKTIDSLVLSLESSPEIILNIETVVVEVIIHVFENCIVDLYEELFEIIGTILYCSKQVSPNMWRVFPLIYRTFKSEALEYLEEMMPSLDNYISYGRNVFISDLEKQHALMDMIYTVIDDKLGREADKIRAMILMESVMLNFRGSIDSHIPKFIAIAYSALQGKVRSEAYRVHCLEVVLNALYYNPVKTLGLMEQENWTLTFFEMWFNNIKLYQRVHDKKLSIVALCAVLTIPVNQMPPSLSSSSRWAELFPGLLQLLGTLRGALSERKRLATGEYESDDDDFGNEFNDEDSENGEIEFDDSNAAFINTIESSLDRLVSDAANPDYDSEDLEEAWETEEFLHEDESYMTPLDEINAYHAVRNTMMVMASTGQASILEKLLSQEQKNSLQLILSENA